MKYIVILISLLFLTSCGSGPSGEGYVSLQVENSRSPRFVTAAALTTSVPDHRLEVTQFRVTISGPGIDPPMVKVVEASATSIEVMGINAGDERRILIEALNSDGEVIRRRMVDNITITPGVTTPIRTQLHTIPVILNLRNGAYVLQEHLRVFGFGEPGSFLELEAEFQGDPTPVSYSQSVTGEPVVVSPSRSTGLFEFFPPTARSGRQTIRLRDRDTDEFSEISVYVIRGSYRPGRKIVSASYHQSLTFGSLVGFSSSENFPQILSQLSHFNLNTRNPQSTEVVYESR